MDDQHHLPWSFVRNWNTRPCRCVECTRQRAYVLPPQVPSYGQGPQFPSPQPYYTITCDNNTSGT